MAVSQNGYSANDISQTKVYDVVPGLGIRLRKGATGALLVHYAKWFDATVEPLVQSLLDDWGYAERPIRGSEELSNHASGTAEDLNSVRHPMGVRGTFTAPQVAAIHKQLLRYNGCLRWGGDYTGRPDEMHVEIDRNLAACVRVLAKVKAQDAAQAAVQAAIASTKASLGDAKAEVKRLSDRLTRLRKRRK